MKQRLLSTDPPVESAEEVIRHEGKAVPTPFLTINAWNEWTEGSYLEPDKINGMKYLEAIRDVFKKQPVKRT